MSEQSSSDEYQPDTAAMSSAEKFEIPAYGGFANEVEVVQHGEAVARAIIDSLAKMGVAPESVVLSGYKEGETRDVDEAKNEPNDELLREKIEEANDLMASGEFEVNTALKQRYLQEINDLRAEIAADPRSTYSFAEIQNLTEENFTENPLYFAGIGGEEAVIGIYNKQRLLEIDPEAVIDEVWQVHASLDEVESAKIGTFHPRYVDQDGRPLDGDNV